MKVLLNGAKGRMGQAIQAIAEESGAVISAALDAGDDPREAIADADVAIDFSVHSATLGMAKACASAGKPLVIGTTGHTAEEQSAVAHAIANLPVVWAGNFSVGVNLLFHLTELVSKTLEEEYHPEIIEAHHRHKVDSPSGTAARLIEVIQEARGLSDSQLRHGREGHVGARPGAEIGVHAIRGGDIVGEHTVMFAGAGERLELTHRATDRRIFAAGALRAAKWVRSQPPGRYSMQDVLGLK